MASTGETWRLGHRPALDGLRGIAVLLVIAFHVLANGHIQIGAGSAGVTVFFTLSGFLITSLLIVGRSATLGEFYRDRGLRLLPALLAVVAIVGAAQVAAGLTPVGRLVPVLLYVGNWEAASGESLGLLVHTWSLSVEEQFYLLWPLALLATRRVRNGPEITAATGVVVAFVARIAYWPDWGRTYYGADTHADALLIGCLLALAAHRGLRWRPGPGVGFGCLVAILAVSVSWNSWFDRAVLIPSVVPWLTAAVIWASCCADLSWMRPRWLVYLGRRSYGIYLWHVPLVFALRYGTTSVWLAAAAAVLGVGVAELSWRWVESPFLRRKNAGRWPLTDVEEAARVLPRGRLGSDPVGRERAVADVRQS